MSLEDERSPEFQSQIDLLNKKMDSLEKIVFDLLDFLRKHIKEK